MGKGRISQHRTQRSHLPVVQFDFTHPNFFAGSDVTILTGIDATSGMVFAAQLPSKRPTPHSLGLVKNFLLNCFFVVLKTNSLGLVASYHLPKFTSTLYKIRIVSKLHDH